MDNKKVKLDMSNLCNFKYEEFWMKANYYKTMEQDEWMEWYLKHCGKCKYMCEICMHGED